VNKVFSSDARINHSEPEKGVIFDFEEIGEGTVSKYQRPIDAQKRAEENALEKALTNSGVNIFYGFQDVMSQHGKKSFEFLSSCLYLWSSAITIYEYVGDPIFENLPYGGIKCTLKLKGTFRFKGEKDHGYEIRTDLKDNKLGLNQPSFYNGDEVKVSFWVTKDSYVHLIVIDEHEKATLLYPNKYIKPGRIRAGEIFKFPDKKKGTRNLSLKAFLPTGKEETVELLHIIITKDEPLFTVTDTQEVQAGRYKQFSLGELSVVFQRLAKLDQSQWSMLVLSYGIKRR